MKSMRDREHDTTNFSGRDVSWTQYYCRFCSADCGKVDSVGRNTVGHCQCSEARAHRAQLAARTEQKTIQEWAELMPVAPTLATLARLALRHPDSAVRDKARAAIAAHGGH